MIRLCNEQDFADIWTIINDGAEAYRGVIPEDRWHDPYMTREKLAREIEDGVSFWGFDADGTLQGVMGIQDVQDVTLIRHAYVRTRDRRSGVGGKLLAHLQKLINRPLLIGTWADASWAIRFYEKHGFRVVSTDQKDQLLKRYWNVPPRQIETSVVLFGGENLEILVRLKLTRWQMGGKRRKMGQPEPSDRPSLLVLDFQASQEGKGAFACAATPRNFFCNRHSPSPSHHSSLLRCACLRSS